MIEKEKEDGDGGDSSVDSGTEKVVPLNGKCFKKLFQIFLGQSVQDRIINLKARNTSHDAFATMISNPKKLTEA